MSGSKYFNRIAWCVTVCTLVLALLLMNGSFSGVRAMPRTADYESLLFNKTEVHTIAIVMDGWEELIANATEEEYSAATVVIDGESYKSIGIRAKGNTSLSTVATLDSERYSFKIEFDHYDSAVSYHGLDKLSLNNLIQDSTMMKDYLSYTLMDTFGVNAPLCSFVYITVNGEDTDSYSNIWDNAKTAITEADRKRLIASLKKLSECEDLASVVDVEQVIRYFVVHNYVCNDDSYTGKLVHNYYLYEKDGQLAMIPWDYNLAFGTFGGGDGTDTVNTPIDSPVSGGSSDRPMLNWIFETEEYTEWYHQYFSEFLSTVDIQDMIDQASDLIDSYVAKDPTAFYSYEEFTSGVEALRQFCRLRSDSITQQLANGETTDTMDYAVASALSLSAMGSMGGADKGMHGRPRDAAPSDLQSGIASSGQQDGSAPPDLPDGSAPSGQQDNVHSTVAGQSAGTAAETDAAGGTEAEAKSAGGTETETDAAGGTETGTDAAEGTEPAGDSTLSRPSAGNMQMPPGDPASDRNGAAPSSPGLSGWIWMISSMIILLLGLLATKHYK